MPPKPLRVVKLPKLLTVGWSNKLLELCDAAILHDGPTAFDFEKVEWAAPFGLTTVSVSLARCLRKPYPVHFIPPKARRFAEYLERIGFEYHLLKGGAVAHRKTSLELKRLSAADPLVSQLLSDLIGENLRLSEDSVYEMRTHLNELMTNGFDHSGSPVGCFVCAQWYPAKQNLRISFADGGIGIQAALRSSGKYPEVVSDASAIRLAVKRGVTSRKKQIGGFGLDFIRMYVRNNAGTMTILSGDAKVNFYPAKIEVKKNPTPFKGTIVDIRVFPKRSRHPVKRKYDDLF